MADEKISALDAKVTIADTDMFPLVDEEAAPDKTKYITGANLKSQMLASLVDKIDKTHLSQDFGASAGRLHNFIATPIAGEILRMLSCGPSPFDGDIDDNAGAHGGQGLDATHVPYDGETKESMFTGLAAYDGSTYWGQIILHNTTKSESCKIVSVDTTDDVILVTADSPDDVSGWADDDVITCQSQTNATPAYIDVDISAQVPATTDAIFLFIVGQDNEDNYDALRVMYFHPFEAYSTGKRQWLSPKTALASPTATIPLKIVSQKLTMALWSGCVNVHVILAVKASLEYADT